MAPSSKSKSGKRRKCCFFPGGCCFGSFPPEHDEKKTSGEGKIVKTGSGKKSSRWGQTVPVFDSTFTKVSNSSKEIQVVVEAEAEVKADDHDLPVPLTDHKVIVNKDMVSERSKNVKNSGRILSPVKHKNGTLSDPATKLSHSVSMPLLQRKSNGGIKGKKELSRAGAGEFDPIVGALMLTVTLIVMLTWGKVSAIISTALWFYIMPRIVRPNDTNINILGHKKNGSRNAMNLKSESSENDLGSLEEKRKVVLQGFLDRSK